MYMESMFHNESSERLFIFVCILTGGRVKRVEQITWSIDMSTSTIDMHLSVTLSYREK